MSRKAPTGITIKSNLRCSRVYPVEGTNKSISDLNTVGLKLSKEQAIDLSRTLLAASQDWDDLEVTAYRLKKRKSDGTYPVTVTSFQSRKTYGR